MRRSLAFLLVFLAPPAIKPFLLRRLVRGSIGKNVRIGWLSSVVGRSITIGDEARVAPLTLIRCGGDVHIGAYAIVSSFNLIYGGAGISLGRHSYVGPQCLINVDENVAIGDRSGLGPRSMLFTHGLFLPYTEGYVVRFAGIKIGDRVWCAAGVFIHPGVTIGDDAFVNSRSVVRRSVPAGDVVEGFPATHVTDISRIRRPMTPESVDAAIREMVDRFASVVLERRLEVVVASANDVLAFQRSGIEYRVVFIDSSSDRPWPARQPRTRTILLLNRDPAGQDLHGSLVFNFLDTTTRRHRDPIHAELRDFFHANYGVAFEYVDR